MSHDQLPALALFAVSIHAPPRTVPCIDAVAAAFGAVSLPPVSSRTLPGPRYVRAAGGVAYPIQAH